MIWLDKQEIGRDDMAVVNRIISILKENGIIDGAAGNALRDKDMDKNTDGKITEGKESGK